VVLSANPRIDAEVIDRAIAIGDHQAFSTDTERPTTTDEVDLDTLQQNYLQTLMERYQGDRTKVANIAGISERTLYRKLESRKPD